ncbi:hypothetical protein BJX68DRAFT_260775 [Aspergillus pseudodeflectus]|uniref:Uncharacterized protein n=1 Tax=Aspergillus pseudodeflectus TaxID=176178 RepID=A0ABR4LBR8_9EURO
MLNLESVGPMVCVQDSYAESLGLTTPGLVISLFQVNVGYEFVFPKLASVNGQLYVNADLSSIEIPALTHTNASIHIAPSFDRDLDLDLLLVRAGDIQLTRNNIKRFAIHLPSYSLYNPLQSLYQHEHQLTNCSLNLDSLQSFTNLTIHSRVDFPCSALNKTLIRHTHYLDKTNSIFLCTSVPDDSGLSTGAKIATGVAVPVGVVLVAAVGFWFFVWKREQGAKRRSAGVALNQREVGELSVAMVETSAGGSARGETPPPAYEGPRPGEART